MPLDIFAGINQSFFFFFFFQLMLFFFVAVEKLMAWKWKVLVDKAKQHNVVVVV